MSIPSIIFIIPYRDREHEKIHFEVYMKYILEDIPRQSYSIYFSHQNDDRPFNRGATKNIGFLAMKEKYPNDYKNITFVFHDVDIVPYKKNTFNYKTETGTVKHFYGFTNLLGGIFSIQGGDFEKCNGFPNYWGWGLEDNMMENRVKNNNIIIDRNDFYGRENIKDILNINNSTLRRVSNTSKKLYFKKANTGLSTISNLKYSIQNEFININVFDVEIDPNKDTYYMHDNKISNQLKQYTRTDRPKMLFI